MTTNPLPLTSPESSAPNLPPNPGLPDTAIGEVEEMVGFIQLIDELPPEYRQKFYQALQRLAAGHERRQRVLSYIQDTLCQMKLDLRYLIFDLEATRRERDEYRNRLEFYTQGDY